ncbi:hypothetical protein PQR02_11060 [Paraburkholderia sediminicola]|uniref:Uncharacterized protein n=1 Tax=Paraburkholderia rhynchosiae TaxID=487049 RepID=A0ACC7NHG9_9BURK
MKKLFATAVVSVLALSPIAQRAFAQNIPSATSPSYVKPYVSKRSQLDVMNPPRPASATTVYGADSALKPRADGLRLQAPVNTGTQSHTKRARIPQSARATSSAAASDAYSSDLWNAGQTYASPQTSDPYSAR